MIQLSLFDLVKLFTCCILCYLITMLCMFILTMSGIQCGCGGGCDRNQGRGHNNLSGPAEEGFRNGKTIKTSLTMLFSILTASKTCNSPKTYLKLLRSPMLTFPSSSHKGPLTHRLKEHLWPTNLAPTSLHHLSFHNTIKKGVGTIAKMLQAMGTRPTRCLSGQMVKSKWLCISNFVYSKPKDIYNFLLWTQIFNCVSYLQASFSSM